MKSTRSIVLATALAAALPAHAVSVSQIDQNSPSALRTIATFGQSGLAQSFRQLADNITGAGIRLSNPVGVATDVTIELWSDLPNQGGARLAGGTASGVGGDWVNVFWSAVAVVPDTTYFLLFTGSLASMGVGGDLSDPYPLGQVFASSGFSSFPEYDYAFRTFAEAAPVPEPATWMSMAGGLFALGALARRRR